MVYFLILYIIIKFKIIIIIYVKTVYKNIIIQVISIIDCIIKINYILHLLFLFIHHIYYKTYYYIYKKHIILYNYDIYYMITFFIKIDYEHRNNKIYH